MDIPAKEVMALRQKTGVSMMDCKKALIEPSGDIDKAIELLRKKGIATAEKRAGRATNNGQIAVYVHPGSQLAVMVEVNCETDFVARNDDFKEFGKNIAMHIAASAPIAVSEEDIDAAIIEKERDIYREQAMNEGKKPEFVDKIVDGRVKKFVAENCLLEQIYIKDEAKKMTVRDLLNDFIAKTGENIIISRFVRYQIGC